MDEATCPQRITVQSPHNESFLAERNELRMLLTSACVLLETANVNLYANPALYAWWLRNMPEKSDIQLNEVLLARLQYACNEAQAELANLKSKIAQYK